jgi:hypothetical protein
MSSDKIASNNDTNFENSNSTNENQCNTNDKDDNCIIKGLKILNYKIFNIHENNIVEKIISFFIMPLIIFTVAFISYVLSKLFIHILLRSLIDNTQNRTKDIVHIFCTSLLFYFLYLSAKTIYSMYKILKKFDNVCRY